MRAFVEARARSPRRYYRRFSLDQVTSAGTGFHGPEGVVVDRDGNVYGGGLDGVVRKLSPDGRVSEFARTGGRPAGMAMPRDRTANAASVEIEIGHRE